MLIIILCIAIIASLMLVCTIYKLNFLFDKYGNIQFLSLREYIIGRDYKFQTSSRLDEKYFCIMDHHGQKINVYQIGYGRISVAMMKLLYIIGPTRFYKILPKDLIHKFTIDSINGIPLLKCGILIQPDSKILDIFDRTCIGKLSIPDGVEPSMDLFFSLSRDVFVVCRMQYLYLMNRNGKFIQSLNCYSAATSFGFWGAIDNKFYIGNSYDKISEYLFNGHTLKYKRDITCYQYYNYEGIFNIKDILPCNEELKYHKNEVLRATNIPICINNIIFDILYSSSCYHTHIFK